MNGPPRHLKRSAVPGQVQPQKLYRYFNSIGVRNFVLSGAPKLNHSEQGCEFSRAAEEDRKAGVTAPWQLATRWRYDRKALRFLLRRQAAIPPPSTRRFSPFVNEHASEVWIDTGA